MGLDIIEFVMRTEKVFDISLPDEELSNITTVGEFADLIHQKLLVERNLKHCPSNEAVYEIIKAVLIKEQGIAENSITRNARFVQDLHMD